MFLYSLTGSEWRTCSFCVKNKWNPAKTTLNLTWWLSLSLISLLNVWLILVTSNIFHWIYKFNFHHYFVCFYLKPCILHKIHHHNHFLVDSTAMLTVYTFLCNKSLEFFHLTKLKLSTHWTTLFSSSPRPLAISFCFNEFDYSHGLLNDMDTSLRNLSRGYFIIVQTS